MQSVLMALGIFLLLCGGQFLHVGTDVAAAMHLPAMPGWLVDVLVLAGCTCIYECGRRTNPN